MQALHEHDAMEQRDVLSTPTRAALPVRRARERTTTSAVRAPRTLPPGRSPQRRRPSGG
jgi:hypothetical protein